MSVLSLKHVKTYGMAERADHLEFDIRTQEGSPLLSHPHRHEHFQIKVGLAGEVEQTVGGSVRPFRRGYLGFVLPYRVHLVPHPPGSRFVMINFSQQFLRPDLAIDPLDLEEVDLLTFPELAPFVYQEYLDFCFDEVEFGVIESLLERLFEENARRGFCSLALMRSLLIQMICLVCKKYEAQILSLQSSQGQLGSQRDALQRLSRFLRANLGEKIALGDAANAVNLSPNYLAHLLKKETGKTFVELLTQRRLEHAIELLAHSTSRIEQIAHLCGFPDQAYFTRRFKVRYGRSPRDYRASVRQSQG
ncbi:helix-turn-helix transcriptional regulator [Paraburkholderia oxyphila]|uniref:helix-turn-helix transcriptional regulator n=1 Tax=Paraburkholderia oxyphila TaxID=614212 RepID=UPI000486E64B|nr:AraC family transcriptional regulator [Paraburkholderia oxyphila]